MKERAADLPVRGEEWSCHLAKLGYRIVEIRRRQNFDYLVTEKDGLTSLIVTSLASDFDEKGTTLDAVLAAATGEFERVITIIPRRCAPMLDAHILEQYGVGLMTMDERLGLKEVLRPKVRARTIATIDAEAEAAIKDLTERISALESIVKELTDEISKRAVKSGIRPMIRPPTIDADSPPGDTPDFLKDNPWVGILSERGRNS